MKSVKKPLIGIIILHFGKWQVTKTCLNSLVKIKNPNFNYQIILVDNANFFENKENIKRHRININTIILPTKNRGFAGGNNLGIKYCQKIACDYILFLNNDTKVNSDFLQKLIFDALKNRKGIFGPVIEHQVKGQTFYDYGGNIDLFKYQPKHINKSKWIKTPKLIKRDFISGCCMLVPMNLIDKIKGFDEKFFLYLEDVDLCLRACRFDYQSCVVPEAKIFHFGSQSSTEFIKIYYSWRNSFKLIFRHCSKKYWPTAILFNLVFYPAIFLRWQLSRFKQGFGKYLAFKKPQQK